MRRFSVRLALSSHTVGPRRSSFDDRPAARLHRRFNYPSLRILCFFWNPEQGKQGILEGPSAGVGKERRGPQAQAKHLAVHFSDGFICVIQPLKVHEHESTDGKSASQE
uniref:Uncharacterized protein n=1 Tax=Steinernema glaseri TaxID=37863 RepID=A0A1I8AA92_9BILA